MWRNNSFFSANLAWQPGWSQKTPFWRCLTNRRSAPLLGSSPPGASALTTRLAVNLPCLRLIALTRYSSGLVPAFGFPAARNLHTDDHISQNPVTSNRTSTCIHISIDKQQLTDPVRMCVCEGPYPDQCNTDRPSSAEVINVL